MSMKSNGLNMMDVKTQNRSAILQLIHRSQGISRKDIARACGLTPAAITLITSDLIGEGLLNETVPEHSLSRKGRKEVILNINQDRYAALGICIRKQKFHIICIDLDYTVLFEDTIYTADCQRQSRAIMDKIVAVTKDYLTRYDVLRAHRLLGAGVCVNGLVDAQAGISIASYGIWEDQVHVVSYLTENFGFPVILTNNICALAHGEAFLSNSDSPDDLLFIRYGPGVGAAKMSASDGLNGPDYQSIELGHTISEPNGRPCVCGNRGCLETIVNYDSIEASILPLITAEVMPVLHDLIKGKPENICMKYVLQSYAAGEWPSVMAMERIIHYLALAIQNAICLICPKTVILYGEPFECLPFREALMQELGKFTHTPSVSFSHFSKELNVLGPATIMIAEFYRKGGVL